MNMQDWELGSRPTCRRCGNPLSVEEDTYHDGYRGSPYAHNGRGSYGEGPKHYLFRRLCCDCEQTSVAPLRQILRYNFQTEWLACGHTHPTPYNWWGSVRPGRSRRCKKCRVCLPLDFDPNPGVEVKNPVSGLDAAAKALTDSKTPAA